MESDTLEKNLIQNSEFRKNHIPIIFLIQTPLKMLLYMQKHFFFILQTYSLSCTGLCLIFLENFLQKTQIIKGFVTKTIYFLSNKVIRVTFDNFHYCFLNDMALHKEQIWFRKRLIKKGLSVTFSSKHVTYKMIKLAN